MHTSLSLSTGNANRAARVGDRFRMQIPFNLLDGVSSGMGTSSSCQGPCAGKDEVSGRSNLTQVF